jgi:hypothetical protein
LRVIDLLPHLAGMKAMFDIIAAGFLAFLFVLPQ